MLRKSLGLSISLAVSASLAVAADGNPSVAKLSAAEIVAKNVAARGGLDAWRAVKTLTLSGKVGAGGNQRPSLQVPAQGPSANAPAETSVVIGHGRRRAELPTRPVEEVRLPFVMELERPHKMRFELEFGGKTAVQVFDGVNGWKFRPFLNRKDVEPYTPEELKIASMQADLDGPLVDYAAKGSKVEFVAIDKVENRDTYKLKLTTKDGSALHVWIDASTFLEAKMEGQPRRLDGTDHPVEVYFRDFRPVSGLRIPFVVETKVLPVARTVEGFRDPPVPPESMVLDSVVVNPKLDEALFTKPDSGSGPSAQLVH